MNDAAKRTPAVVKVMAVIGTLVVAVYFGAFLDGCIGGMIGARGATWSTELGLRAGEGVGK